MEYNTYFDGGIQLNRPIDEETKAQLKLLRSDYGKGDQPDSLCCWTVENSDMGLLVWDGEETFYQYVDWLVWLRDNFFNPRGYTFVIGEISWEGDEHEDRGRITVNNNRIVEHVGYIQYKEVCVFDYDPVKLKLWQAKAGTL